METGQKIEKKIQPPHIAVEELAQADSLFVSSGQ